MSNSSNNNSNLKTEAEVDPHSGELHNYVDVNDKNAFEINKRNYGRFICFFFGFKDPIIAIGPDWCYFMFLTILIFLCFFTIFILAKDNIGHTYRLIGIGIYLVQLSSYTIAFIKNPGIPPYSYIKESIDNPDTLKSKYGVCSICKSLIDSQSELITYHCGDCGVCIEGYDHHCPWTSKCIGKGNLKAFYVFVSSTIIYFLYCLAAVFNLK